MVREVEVGSEVTFYAPRMFVHTVQCVVFPCCCGAMLVKFRHDVRHISVAEVSNYCLKGLQVLVLEGADVVVLQHQQLVRFKQS